MNIPKKWMEQRNYTPEVLDLARLILTDVVRGVPVQDAIRKHPIPSQGHVAKHTLVYAYRRMVEMGEWEEDPDLLARIRMKPIRTLSGVTTVTVLTKPYPCPGKCIFCPTEECEPKSYLSDEPGARRALQNHFDPYLQVTTRLQALHSVGHPVDKIELLILGGTFNAYPRRYQHWFVEECFRAMNQAELPEASGADHDFDLSNPLSPSNPPEGYSADPAGFAALLKGNETARHRNVGLVLETRPDEITYRELAWMRSLGCTKLQMGAQSLDDEILRLNQRGHTSLETLQAVNRARAAGFKVVLHWMPNLLGATPEKDVEDFRKLWGDKAGNGGFCPDEIKIYPTQLLESADLYQYWLRGEYHPYTEDQLVHLLADVKAMVPRYCRVNRVIRDIPSTHVVEGNRRTSLRQDALLELTRRGQSCQCIRCREVRGEKIESDSLRLTDLKYLPSAIEGQAASEEHFLSFVTPEDRITGYLRLSIPKHAEIERDAHLSELAGSAIIREVHVYGQSLRVGSDQAGAAQHIGLGTKLIEEAVRITQNAGFSRLAVISAVGTRGYYRSRGFEDGLLYQVRPISL